MASGSNFQLYTISSSSSDDEYNEMEVKTNTSLTEEVDSFKSADIGDENDMVEVTEISRSREFNLSRRSNLGQSKLHTISDSDESDESITFIPSVTTSTNNNLSPLEDCDIIDQNCNFNNPYDIEPLPEFPSLAPALNEIKKFAPEMEKIKKIKLTRPRGVEKNEKALERLQQKERKAQEKALTKALKEFEKETKQTSKPGMAIKMMKLCIDDRLTEISDSEHLFNVLLTAELSYALERNHIPYSIVWYRHISEMDVIDNQLERKERDVLENILLLYIPLPLFVDMIYSSIQKRKGHSVEQQSLLEYVVEVHELFPQMDITIVTVNLQNFLKRKRGNSSSEENNKVKMKSVSLKDVEEVLIEVQLQMFLNYRSVENFTEFGNLLIKFTKAIADAPMKKDKNQQQHQFSWYAQADSSCPVKIGKNGDNSLDLWQQQIQQFNLITKDISQAIAAKYPSPSLLIEAYSKCESTKDAEKLLENIIVRRDYGPLGTTRKVGPQLSYKLFRFLTSTNANELLQR